MIYPKGAEIYKLIENLIHSNKDINVISVGVVMHLEVMGTDYYIYSKCVTYAGKPYPINTTRAQLPKRDEFEAIKTGNNIFLFLGFDVENNVFVCWDPNITKERLNKKSYVSFFSRLNLQQSVEKGSITTAALQNNFKYVLFKQEDLCYFLLNVHKYFTEVEMGTPIISINEKVQGYLSSVEDDVSVKLFIDEMCEMDESASILSVVSGCFNEFGEFYHEMKLKDWYSIVNEYLTNKDSVFYYGNIEPEIEENESEENEVEYDEIDKASEDIQVNSYYEPLPSDDVVENVSEAEPVIIKTTSKSTCEGIINEVQDEERHVALEDRVCCSFPLLVMKYLMNNDYIVYNNIIHSFSTHEFLQGIKVEAYKYKDENVEIPRFFLPEKYYSGLTTTNQNRWIPEVKFPIDGNDCFISNQWVGHDVEKKSNLRINDFAYMIYKLSGKKYYINFIPSGRIYIMQLVHIKKKRIIDTNTDLVSGWTRDVMNCVERIPNDIFRLKDVYAFTEELQEKHPDNKTIRASIRHKLQTLRNKGYIEFVGNGKYRKLKEKSSPHHSEQIVNIKQTKIEPPISNNVWLICYDINHFDVEGCFKKFGQIYWTHRGAKMNVKIGDIAYLYSNWPECAVRYKVEVVDSQIPYSQEMDVEDEFSKNGPSNEDGSKYKYFLVRPIAETHSPALCLSAMQSNGLVGKRTATTILSKKEYKPLREYIEQHFDDADSIDEQCYMHFVQVIDHIKQAKIKGEVIVAKPVLLLSLIDGVENGVFGSNRFCLNEWLEERYLSLMKQYTKDSQFDAPSPISNPFWHMATDGFWHLQLKEEHEGKATPSTAWLKENVEFARFDDDLWVLLQNREWRMKLRDFIIEHKLTK